MGLFVVLLVAVSRFRNEKNGAAPGDGRPRCPEE